MFEKPRNKSSVPVTDTPPPPAEAALVSLLTGYIPDFMPMRPAEAARFWLQRQEPQTFSENPHFNIDKDGNGSWKCPFNDRVSFTLAKFLSMNKGPQMFIIDHIEQGYSWRGDEIAFYKMVIAETDKFRGNPEEYKKIGNVVLRSSFHAATGE